MESCKQNPHIAIQGLSFAYPEREKKALDDIGLMISRGEFIVLCGSSGSGKTTLLRHLKPSLAPHGIRLGEIYFEGEPLSVLNRREEASKIGYVMQNPESQMVTDKVWHELAFGLESLGFDTAAIRLRVAEMASFFGIQNWFHQSVSELSGGQKQLLALASVMALQPCVLILDEPTGQLDPIAASEFLATVGKINRELGVTVILTEHRLEEAFPLASRAVVMAEGKIVQAGAPAQVGAALRASGHGMFHAMPVPMRVWSGVDSILPCPVTVGEGRAWLRQTLPEPGAKEDVRAGAYSSAQRSKPRPMEDAGTRKSPATPAIEWIESWFRYEKDQPDVIKNLSFEAYHGELTAILGGNGTGKTTALSMVAGICRPHRGKVLIEGNAPGDIPANQLFDGLLGVLPQNPQALFTGKTVREDLMEMLSGKKAVQHTQEKAAEIQHIAALCQLEPLMDAHPYDLSGGEQQRVALAKVLLLKPRILLLDEPTKGLDAEFKVTFAGILEKLTAEGAAVIMVSHDIEFCAEYADRCALFFDGAIVTANSPRAFFPGNSFYTSAANRMARAFFPDAITAKDIIRLLRRERAHSLDQGSSQGSLPEVSERCEEVNATGDQSPHGRSLPGMPESRERLNVADAPGSHGHALSKAPEGYETSKAISKQKSHACSLSKAPEGDEKSVKASVGRSENPVITPNPSKKLRLYRMIAMGIAGLCLIFSFAFAALHLEGFSSFISGGEEAVRAASKPSDAWRYAGIILLAAIGFSALIFAVSWKREKPKNTPLQARIAPPHKLPKRTLTAALIVIFAIPLTIYVGVYYLGDRKYYLIALLIIFETLVPFAAAFERRKPQARELVIIAVLCAIAVAGRTAFFMLPHFKPVAALVIIAGVAFGAESGFLVGAVSAFVSNMFFGQGPWTPWQMFAFGIIGFLAGILFQKGILLRSRVALCTFGGLAAFILYGGIMNSAMVLMYQTQPTKAMFMAAYLQGIPLDLVHALATVVFLAIVAKSMLEKLDRIKVKYGLLETQQ